MSELPAAGAEDGLGLDAAATIYDLYSSVLGQALPVALATLIGAAAVVTFRTRAWPPWLAIVSALLALGSISPYAFIFVGLDFLWIPVVGIWLVTQDTLSTAAGNDGIGTRQFGVRRWRGIWVLVWLVAGLTLLVALGLLLASALMLWIGKRSNIDLQLGSELFGGAVSVFVVFLLELTLLLWTQDRQTVKEAEDLRMTLQLGRDFREMTLSGRDLRGIQLAHKNFRGARFDNADLSEGNLSGANLAGADFRNAKLRGAQLISADVSLTVTKAPGRGARIRPARFMGADLSRADLSGANMKGANLSKAVLREAQLCDVELTPGEYKDGEETKTLRASLAQADLKGADLTGADLTGADLTGADLSETKLTGVISGGSTTWPDGFSHE